LRYFEAGGGTSRFLIILPPLASWRVATITRPLACVKHLIYLLPAAGRRRIVATRQEPSGGEELFLLQN